METEQIKDLDWHCGDCDLLEYCGKVDYGYSICMDYRYREMSIKEYIDKIESGEIDYIKNRIEAEGVECELCGSDYADEYFKTKEYECICDDCLIEIAEAKTCTITQYYICGDYIGDSDDMQEVIDSICRYAEAERI